MDRFELNLVLKVFIFSLGTSMLVKYGGSVLSFTPSNSNALIAIFLPVVVIFLLLLRRSYNISKS